MHTSKNSPLVWLLAWSCSFPAPLSHPGASLPISGLPDASSLLLQPFSSLPLPNNNNNNNKKNPMVGFCPFSTRLPIPPFPWS